MENKTSSITNLQDMIESKEYHAHQSDTLLNPQYHMINDTYIDVDLILKCQEDSMFGVSHGDFIDCWINYLDIIDLDDETRNSIIVEIVAVQTYHTEQKTIDNII